MCQPLIHRPLKSSAVDQRGCQIYVWLSFCQAQTGNIWTEMLSVMWQSFTTGCTLSAQDSSGPGIRSRWRTLKYFTVDPSFGFFSLCSLEPVQSPPKKNPLSIDPLSLSYRSLEAPHSYLWRETEEERLVTDRYSELCMTVTCNSDLSAQVLVT